MKQPPAIIIQLIHMEGPLKGQIQEFRQSEIFIGRSATCQVCFPKDLAIVSRVHARIVREGNRFMLVDQSTNGTYLNGKQVKEAILKDGDILLFAQGGPKVSFLTQTVDGSLDVIERVPPAVDVAPMVPEPLRVPQPPPTPSPEPVAAMPQPVPVPPPITPPPLPKAPVAQAVVPVEPDPQRSGDIPVQQVQKPLVVQYGPTLQAFNALPVTIGNGAQCDFRLHHPAVFERHAQIFYYQEHYWIKDLTGKNLVSINGRSIDGQGMLEPEYRLSMSPSGPEFRFLGGGRLAEIEVSEPEQSLPSPGQGEGRGTSSAPQGKAVRQLGAMMKKILKR